MAVDIGCDYRSLAEAPSLDRPTHCQLFEGDFGPEVAHVYGEIPDGPAKVNHTEIHFET